MVQQVGQDIDKELLPPYGSGGECEQWGSQAPAALRVSPAQQFPSLSVPCFPFVAKLFIQPSIVLQE